MFQAESLSKDFIRGLAFLDSYIKLNNKSHLQDINIVSEYFFCQLLNVLYGWDLHSANAGSRQAPGYDLISEKDKLIIQVTSQCRTEKMKDCFGKLNKHMERRAELAAELARLQSIGYPDEKKLELMEIQLDSLPDLGGYELRFLFLNADASNLRNRAGDIPDRPAWIRFDPQSSVMDFSTLTRCVLEAAVHTDTRESLERFMGDFPDLFVRNILPTDHVQDIIDEYARNFRSRLFLHSSRPSSRVTLENLYVAPAYRDPMRPYRSFRDIPALLSDFLWQRPKPKEDRAATDDIDATIDEEQMLLIEGDAAIGKTSLVSWLCHHYNLAARSNSDNVGQAIFLNRKIVCIRLRELDLTRGVSARDTVLEYLEIKKIQDFKRRYPKAILILDGADELSMVSGSTIRSIEEFLMELQQAFHENKFIVTTRPKFLNTNSNIFQRSLFGIRRVELMHYDRDMRREWLENYKNCGETVAPATEEYINSLPDGMAEGVADTPLALYLLVRCRIRDELRGNSWALYREIFTSAITDGRYNRNFDENQQMMTAEEAETNYRVVRDIAFRMFQNSKEDRYYLYTYEIDEVISRTNLNGLTREQVRSTCVLCAYWKNSTTLGALEFYHNNIRDFFLCEYISSALIRCIEEHRTEGLNEALIAEFCRLLCWGNIAGTTWEQAFTFLRLRLWHEKENPGPDTLYARLRLVKDIPNLIWQLTMSRELWCHKSPEIPYISAKRVLGNAMMLVRVLMDTEPDLICYWSDEKQQADWIRSELFRDWGSLLTQSVKLSEQQQIGVLSKTKWTDMDWTGRDLQNADFSGGDLARFDFTGAMLEGSSFRNAKLSDCCFRKALLWNIDFYGAHLSKADFSGTDLKGCDFKGVRICGCVWENTSLRYNRFENSDVEGLVLSGSRMFGMQFIGTRLSQCRFPSCEFPAMHVEAGSVFEHVDFSGATLSGQIKDSGFCKCTFNGGHFDEKCRISGTFTDSDFVGVNWSGRLTGARFEGCNLNSGIFSGIAELRDVEFVDCTFFYAAFKGIKLTNVRFINPDLCNADFSGATLDHCTIAGAKTDLQRARFVETENLGSEFPDVNFYGAFFHNAAGFENIQRIAP